jgi:hypothetical protein
METEASQEQIEAWLATAQLDSISKKIAWKIFFRTYFKFLFLMFAALLPIIIVVLTGSFWFLLLILPLLLLGNKYGHLKVTFTPSPKCPICQHALVIQERNEDETWNYYLKCDECSKEPWHTRFL